MYVQWLVSYTGISCNPVCRKFHQDLLRLHWRPWRMYPPRSLTHSCTPCVFKCCIVAKLKNTISEVIWKCTMDIESGGKEIKTQLALIFSMLHSQFVLQSLGTALTTGSTYKMATFRDSNSIIHRQTSVYLPSLKVTTFLDSWKLMQVGVSNFEFNNLLFKFRIFCLQIKLSVFTWPLSWICALFLWYRTRLWAHLYPRFEQF